MEKRRKRYAIPIPCQIGPFVTYLKHVTTMPESNPPPRKANKKKELSASHHPDAPFLGNHDRIKSKVTPCPLMHGKGIRVREKLGASPSRVQPIVSMTNEGQAFFSSSFLR